MFLLVISKPGFAFYFTLHTSTSVGIISKDAAFWFRTKNKKKKNSDRHSTTDDSSDGDSDSEEERKKRKKLKKKEVSDLLFLQNKIKNQQNSDLNASCFFHRNGSLTRRRNINHRATVQGPRKYQP